VMFAVVGIAFTVIAYGIKFGDTVLLPGYAMGTPARMGPAFFPFWLGLILTGLGILISVRGLKSGNPVPKFHFGAIGWVLGAVVLFGFILKALGMVLSGIILVIVASQGSHEFRWKPIILLALGLVAFCAAVFVYGLKLPIPLCPDLEALQNMRACRG
jgi:predicted membrane channel-forming protein YqfA (hemolysin III family)